MNARLCARACVCVRTSHLNRLLVQTCGLDRPACHTSFCICGCRSQHFCAGLCADTQVSASGFIYPLSVGHNSFSLSLSLLKSCQPTLWSDGCQTLTVAFTANRPSACPCCLVFPALILEHRKHIKKMGVSFYPTPENLSPKAAISCFRLSTGLSVGDESQQQSAENVWLSGKTMNDL